MSQTPDQKLDHILRTFAQQAQKDYPALKDAFILLDSKRWKIFEKFDISKFEGLTQEAFEEQKESLLHYSIHTSDSFSARIYYDIDGKMTGAGGVIVYGQARSPTEGLVSVESPYGIYATLYHELGHLVVKGAGDENYSKNRTYAESAADIYSLIRLHQDFGKAVCIEQAHDLIQERTDFMLDGRHYSHFSVPAVIAFLKNIDQIDFNAITPEAADELAQHFAVTYSIHENDVKKFSAQFGNYWRDRSWQDRKNLPDHDTQKDLVEKVVSSNDILFTQTAFLYLRHIDADPALLHALRLHEIKLAKEDITSAMPNQQQPKTPAVRFEK